MERSQTATAALNSPSEPECDVFTTPAKCTAAYVIARALAVNKKGAFVKNLMEHGHNMPVAEMRALYSKWTEYSAVGNALITVFDRELWEDQPDEKMFLPLWYKLSDEQ
jgi:hypothetical protein